MNSVKISHIIAFTCLTTTGWSQNLVPNGGFEEYIGKHHSRYWTQAQGDFNHFYHNDLGNLNGGAANGSGYHCLCMYGMQENEFMHVALGKKLEKGKKYLLSMSVRLSNNADEVHKYDLPKKLKRLDWYFTSIPINVLNKLFITAEPSSSFDFISPHSTKWINVSQEYTANGDEQFLTIGNITRIYEKIQLDEKLDSLKTLLLSLDKREQHEMDSVRNKYIVELDEYKVNTAQDYSMNSLVESKRKRKRREQKKFDQQIAKNNEIGKKIRDAQQVVKKKYYVVKIKLESQIENEKQNFAVNVCFDDVSITEIKGVAVSDNNSVLNSKPVAGKTVVLNNIYFKTDSHELLNESTKELDELISWMKTYSKLTIQISGHTDNVGTEKHNMELSANRAKEVGEYLIKNGIKPERLQHKGYAARFALADNGSEQGRALNRRVEVTILKIE